MTNDRIYMDNIGYIYKATCKTTGLCYIGQTSRTLEERARDHWYSRNDGTKFHNALLEYGRDDFTWEVIETCDESQLDTRENYWISYYNSYKNGLNEDEGIGFPNALRHPSDKMNKSRSDKLIGNTNTKDVEPWNKNKTKETDERIAGIAEKLSEHNTGITLSDSHKTNISRGVHEFYESNPEAKKTLGNIMSDKMKGNSNGAGNKGKGCTGYHRVYDNPEHTSWHMEH